MIYTVTFSPSIDYILKLDDLTLGEINRSKGEKIVAGGKGVNVSVMLKNLGEDSVATGFIGGFTGDYIKKFLDDRMIENEFVIVPGNSRINVKITGNNTETAINAQGPDITNEKITELLSLINRLIENDYLIISGNVPPNLPPYIYELILSYIRTPNVKIIIDCEKLLLKNLLKYHPFLIKPNKKELEDYFNQKIDSVKDMVEKCKILKQQGAKNVIVSLGDMGAFMLTEDNRELFVEAPKIKMCSSVGSGDALIAGFVSEYNKTGDYEQALRYGVACGTASAEQDYLADKKDVDRILEKIK